MFNFISDNLPLVLVILVLFILFFTFVCLGYVKAPPNKIAVITGLRKKPRMLQGRAGVKIPFFEKVDWLYIGQASTDIKTDEFIPTKDFINIKVDAVAKVCIMPTEEGQRLAMKNFLNMTETQIVKELQDSLQGNLREIIGTMELKELSQNKKEFGDQVQEKAQVDMNSLGIKILSFNVQTVIDKNGLIENLGIENTAKIKQDAQIAQAEADRNVAVAQAQALKEANEAKVESQKAISERNNELAIRQAELKITEDSKKAEADAAYEIQKQESRKTIEISTQNAEIARREREIELQRKEAQVAAERLDATVKKKAEAEKYAAQLQADAELYRRQKEAEAELFEKEKEAEAIRKQGEAEADAIRAKGIAEAEAIDKKAEAMKKYGNAAIIEMLVNVLPDVAKSVAEPISAIDKVTVIGGDTNGVSDMAGNVPVVMAKVMESVKEATGVDMTEIIKANTYDAKVTKNINVTGVTTPAEGSAEE